MCSNSLCNCIIDIFHVLLDRCSDDNKSITYAYDHRNESIFVPMAPSFSLDSKFKEGMFLLMNLIFFYKCDFILKFVL